MGFVYADITLQNAGDVTRCKDGLIKEHEIRQTTLTAIVDTGAATLVINEIIRQQLGLDIGDRYPAKLANGTRHEYFRTEPVIIHWKNRKAITRAIFVPEAPEVLLGAIPLEEMDLIINPLEEKLTGAHGDEMVFRV